MKTIFRDRKHRMIIRQLEYNKTVMKTKHKNNSLLLVAVLFRIFKKKISNKRLLAKFVVVAR